MLDAESYPKAFIVLGNKKIELSDVNLKNDIVRVEFLIRKNDKKMKIQGRKFQKNRPLLSQRFLQIIIIV